MEYYHYVNIFETKGLEYILVICFLITLVLFVRNLERPPRWQRKELPGRPGAAPGGAVILPERRDATEASPETDGENRDRTRTPSS